MNKCTNCHNYIWEDVGCGCDNPKALHQPQPSIIPAVPYEDRGGHGTHDPQPDFLTARGGVR